MKLNKVMALALSGLMAVSMLAGCSNGTPNGEENNQGQEVVATDAAAAMNKAQSTVKFESDATLNSVLAAAIAQAKLDDVVETAKDATLEAKVKTGASSKQLESVYTYMANKLPQEYKVQGANIEFDNDKPKTSEKVTQTAIYTMKAGAYDEDTAAAMVAKVLDADNFVDVYTASKKTYEVDYTGAVSVDTATVTKDGETYSIYVVAVSVTQTPTEVN